MDNSRVSLDLMRTFVRIVERGTLSAVARELGIGQSSVTRHLRELEEALGAPLLSRTTRRMALTEEGSRYYARCVQILQLVERADEEVRDKRGAASGTVRISCTAALGVLHISRMIFEFQDLYPEIDVDLSLTDERIDLVREGVDVALRLGPVAESSVKLRALGQSQRILVAAPAYLRARGVPASPDALTLHEGVRMINIAGSERLQLLDPKGVEHSIPFGGRLRIDHGLAAREALIAGRGIAPAHRWLVDDLLANGALQVVLPDYWIPAVPLSLLIVPDRSDIRRVRLLIDFLAQKVPTLPGIRRHAGVS